MEYAALVLLVATLVTAVFAFDLPTDVRAFYADAICRIDPENDNCGDHQEADGQDSPGQDSDGSEDSPSPSPSPGDDTELEEEPSEEDGDPEEDSEEDPEEDDGPEILYSADFMADFEELQEANTEFEEAESAYDELGDEILLLLSDLIGLEDARKCLAEGDIVACIWTVVGLTPWGKGAKIIKKIPKVAKLVTRWRKLKKSKEAAQERRTSAQESWNRSSKSCPITPPDSPVSNRLTSAAAAYPVTSAGGPAPFTIAFDSSGFQGEVIPANNRKCTKLDKGQLTDLAKFMGYKPTKKNAKWGKVWENKKGKPRYISFDKDQHNGEFKGASKSETLENGKRDGSYKVVVDENGTPSLEWVKD